MQYVEIYNEQIKDLLEPEKTAKQGLDVREAPGKGTFVAGAANMVVGSRKELEALMHKGNLYRTTEATNCNEVSSRSHAVLQLRVDRRLDLEDTIPDDNVFNRGEGLKLIRLHKYGSR